MLDQTSSGNLGLITMKSSQIVLADMNPILRLDDLLASISVAHRRAIARRIRRCRAALADGWVQRHQYLPSIAENMAGEFNGWKDYRNHYAIPMLSLVERGIKLAQKQLLYVYKDERLRFFKQEPHNQTARATLAQMLEDDLQDLLTETGLATPGSELGTMLSDVMNSVHSPLVSTSRSKVLKMALIGDCVMTEIRTFLAPALDAQGIKLDTRHFYFSAHLQADLNTSEIEAAIEKIGFDLIAVSFLTFEGLPLYTSIIREASSFSVSDDELDAKCDGLLGLIDDYVAALRKKTNTPILLHGCSGLPLSRVRRFLPIVAAMAPRHARIARRLNDGLAAIASGVENVILLDEMALLSEIGARAANRRLLPRTFTHNTLFHPSAFGPVIAEEYARIARAYQLLAKTKVLLVDFDNTLWKGVMADGPVEHNVEGQNLLKELKNAGILLVSVSKNDPKNIRWDEIALDQDDFVLHKISWDTKPQTVSEVVSQLDLDSSSFVLIDDNPVERELVTSSVPGVTALDSTDPDTWRYLRLLLQFPATRQTEEANRRTAMYREAARRREAISAPLDYGAMMQSLNLRVGWRRAQQRDLERLHELVSRTNQFNTTTVRYSISDLAQMIRSSEHDLFVANLSDKFGSLGLVGSVITRVEDDSLTYESVVMSCRAMGFGLEHVLVSRPLEERKGIAKAIGRYVPTERNTPCADLFSRSGFVQCGPEIWMLDTAAGRPEIPRWLTIEGT